MSTLNTQDWTYISVTLDDSGTYVYVDPCDNEVSTVLVGPVPVESPDYDW